MSNTKKYIGICLALLVLMGGGLYFILLIPESNEDDPVYDSGTYEENVTTDILIMDISLLESVGFENEYGQFEILVSQDEETADDGSLLYNYTVKDYEDFAHNEIMLESAVERASNLVANRVLGELEDLEPYGLSEPRATISVNLKDGTSHTLYLGDEAADTDGMYVLYNEQVYICDMNTAFLNPIEASGDPYHLVIEDLENEDGSTYSQLEEMSLSGSYYEEVINIVYDNDAGTYLIDSHGSVQANATEMENIASSLSNISASAVEKYNPTEEELLEYGLRDVYQRLEFILNGETHSINLSKENEDGSYYMYADDDKTVIYTVPDTVVGTWNDKDYLSLRSDYVFLPAVSDVLELYIDINGKVADVKIDRTEVESASTDEQTAYQYSAKVNGEEILYDNFTAFYLELISVPVLNDEELEYGETPIISVNFVYHDGTSDKLEFFTSLENEGRAVAVLNGEYLITVRSEDLDKLEEEYALIVG